MLFLWHFPGWTGAIFNQLLIVIQTFAIITGTEHLNLPNTSFELISPATIIVVLDTTGELDMHEDGKREQPRVLWKHHSLEF